MAIVHELSWSVSRASTFEACRRRYYFDYYYSWGGWDSRAAEGRRRAYLLKKMTRMPMLAGEVLHQVLHKWFEGKRRGKILDQETLLADALAMLREGYKCSRDGKWRERPSKLVHLAEHHYREERIDESTGAAGTYGKQYVQRIEDGLQHFFSMPELAAVREADPESYLALEEMGTIELFGTKVYAIPDFAYRDAEGRVHIYDWKSGAPRERDAFQLSAYVLYAAAKWDAEPDEVVCLDVYLPRGEVKTQQLDASEVAAVRAQIEGSMEEMSALHFDADRSEGDAEAFSKVDADGPGARECGSCHYRELCGR